MDDNQIIALYWQRNEQAISETETKYGSYCRSIVYGILQNGADTEECINDTWLRAWDAIPPQKPARLSAFLGRIARNLALMKLRERARTQDLPPEDWESFAIDSHDVTTEDRTVLAAALSTLSDQERQIIMLHVTAGLKHREIAEMLGMPLATVLSKYARSLKKLKKALEEDSFPNKEVQ